MYIVEKDNNDMYKL